MTGERTRPYTVLYDGHCGVCRRLAKRLAALDRRSVFEMVPSQQPDVPERFPWIPASAFAETLQLVRNSDKRTWQGAMAVEEILRRLRGGWLVVWVFSVPFGRRLADRLYRWFADHRHVAGCGERCSVQVPSLTAGE
ncbi:MAG TPA: DUF393 domain-containing protein [Gemmatimonadaceae bacterium]